MRSTSRATHCMPIAIRGGGHSIAGSARRRRGMLIDLTDMRAVHVDPHANRRVVQGGALWADVDRETQAFGLVAPGGVVSDTGVAGLTLGGGDGWVRRKYGLTIDSSSRPRSSRADGRVLTARHRAPRPLLGAPGRRRQLRRRDLVHVRAEPARPARRPSRRRSTPPRSTRRSCAAGATTSKARRTRSPRSWSRSPSPPTRTCRRRCTTARSRSSAPSTAATRRGPRATRPLRELGTSSRDLSGPAPFTGVQSGFDGLFPAAASARSGSRSTSTRCTDDAIDTLTALADDRPAPLAMVEVMQMGGAIANVDPEATAFAQRTAPYLVASTATGPTRRRRAERRLGPRPPGTA